MGRLLGDRYQVVHPLWRDRLGETYVARDRKTGIPVTVRTLSGDLATAPVVGRFHTEHRRLTALRHPHLAGVLDLTVDHTGGDTVLTIVSEAAVGHNLRHHLRATGTPAPEEAVRVAADLAAGLHALHHAGLLLENLKPDNVVLTPDGRVQLTDIALAHLVADAPVARNRLRATVAEPAPELLTGAAPTPASDLFALGVLLQELTRHRWPTPLRRLVRQLRARDPRARPTAHQARARLLDGRADDEPHRWPVSVSASAMTAGRADPDPPMWSGSTPSPV